MEESLIIFIQENAGLIAFIVILNIILKGLALWRAAQLSHKHWFIAILIINSVGILEMIYLLFISKKYSVEIKNS